MTPFRPLAFTWPYGLVFLAVGLWSFLPEFRIVRNAQKAVKNSNTPDAGSIHVITIGGGLASFIAFPLAWVPSLHVSAALEPVCFFLGVGTIVAGGLLRRHCWRQLGASFTGDVRASADQHIVTTGAYSLLRHPSYTAGILMNTGMGLAIGSWASALVLAAAAFAVYAYRIAVEERTLLAVVGEPYREFTRTRKRLIPFVY